MAGDEARHYSYFRRTFERHNEREKHGRIKRLTVILSRTLLVQDEDLRIAFSSLNAHWTKPQPFPQEDYAGYFRLVSDLIQDHFPLAAASRMLMQLVADTTWLERLAAAALPRILHFARP